MVTNEIVVGADAAWRRAGAVDWALQEAVLRRMPLRAVHLVDERRRHADVAPVTIDGQVIIPDPVPGVDQRVLDELSSYVAAADPELDLGTDVLVGTPSRRLAELSGEVELTVVGRRGAGKFARLLIGTTSEYVAYHGQGPVIVVPAGWQARAQAPIVVGVDAHEQNDAALDFAFEMAELHHAPLRMVHAGETMDGLVDERQAKHPDIHVERRLVEGHPVEALLDAAESPAAQLLVIGGHHHRASTLMLGSVARGVLHHATTPVAVVHERS
ncbi:universal stress protein [Kribbella sp. NPDC058693]|uniref:universal stress protein n=1 Tax=Kribbella sp. NPDC058693 TaxID=3346602 RepID=UPI00365595D4